MRLLWETELPNNAACVHIGSENAYFVNLPRERKFSRFYSLSLSDGSIRSGQEMDAWIASVSSLNLIKKEIYVSGYKSKSSRSGLLAVFDSSSLEIKKIYDGDIPVSRFLNFDHKDNVILANSRSGQITLLNLADETVKYRKFARSVYKIFKVGDSTFLIPDYFDGKIYKFDSLTLKENMIFSGEPFFLSQIVGETFYSSGVYYDYGRKTSIFNALFPKQTARKRIKIKNGNLYVPRASCEFRITNLTTGSVKTYNPIKGFFRKLMGGSLLDFKVFKNKCLFVQRGMVNVVELDGFKKIKSLRFENGYEVLYLTQEPGKILLVNPKTRRLQAVKFHID